MKIAPTLAASLHYIPGRAGTRGQAQAEFRALVEAAKALRKAVKEADKHHSEKGVDFATAAIKQSYKNARLAVARLERVSREKP